MRREKEGWEGGFKVKMEINTAAIKKKGGWTVGRGQGRTKKMTKIMHYRE